MAEPLQKGVYDPDDEKPVIRPDLKALEGGGESSERGRDHLHSAPTGPNAQGDYPEADASQKSASPDEIREAEERGAGGLQENLGASESKTAGSEDDNQFGYREEKSRFSRFRRQKPKSSRGSFGKKALLIGSPLGVVGIILLLLLLSSFKVIHFAEIMSASGYARFNGILQERATQDIFDASVVNGEGSVQLQGRTLMDRLLFRNVDRQIAELGRADRFKMNLNSDGKLDSVQVGQDTVSLDGITKELGFGDNYASIADGLSKLNPANASKAMRVRYEFTQRLESSVNDELALEPRYIRGRLFGTISDNIGFSFSRWRQAARDFLGKTPNEAFKEDEVNQVEADSAKPIETGSESVDEATKLIKSPQRIQDYLDKHPGAFDLQDFMAANEKYVEAANTVQDVAQTVGGAVIIVSLACMAHQTFSKIPDITQNNEKQASLLAANFMATSHQTKAGDTVAEAEGAAATELDGGENSPAYLRATGQPQNDISSKVATPRIHPNFSPQFVDWVTKFTSPTRLGLTASGAGWLTDVPGIKDIFGSIDSTFCDTLLSPQGAVAAGAIGVIAQAVIAALTAGAGAAVEEGSTNLAVHIFLEEFGNAILKTGGELLSFDTVKTVGLFTAYSFGLQFIAMLLGGGAFSSAVTGANKVEAGFVGTNVLQSRQIRTMYGRPISGADASSADKQYTAMLKQSWQTKGVYERYFAKDNPYSLFGLMSAQVPSSIASFATSIRSSFAHIGSIFNFLALPKLAFAGSGQAMADSGQYGDVQQWGDTPQERDLLANDPTYSIGQNENYITQAEIQKYDQQYGKCFDPSKTQAEVEADKDCRYKDEHDNVNPIWNDPQFFRYRIYKRDSMIVDQFSSPRIEDALDSGQFVSPTPALNGSGVYIVGDSLTEGMKTEGDLAGKLTAASFHVTQIEDTVGIGIQASLDKVNADAPNVQSSGVVVVELGTNNARGANEAAIASQINAMVQQIKFINPSARIFWVNLYSTKFDVSQANAAIAAQAGPEGYTVIDWNKEAQTPGKYSFDPSLGVHQTTGQGYANMADFVVNSIK